MDLLGVALIARSPIEGSRVVFRYPPLKREVSSETVQSLGPLFGVTVAPAGSGSSSAQPLPGGVSSSGSTLTAPLSQLAQTVSPASNQRVISPMPVQRASSSDTSRTVDGGFGGSSVAPYSTVPQDIVPSADFSAFALPSVVIAAALTPKPVLCDRPFSLWLGDTLFVGMPTIVPPSPRAAEGDVNFFHRRCVRAVQRARHSWHPREAA